MAEDPLADWDYDLPAERIASRPVEPRDAARLLCLARGAGAGSHRRVADLPTQLRAGDLLVANDTRVMAARLRGRRRTGGAVELLLLAPGPGPVEALARPARRLKVGEELLLEGGDRACIRERRGRSLVVELSRPPVEVMRDQGELPLPPYLGRMADAQDAERYQTPFAGPLGAAAAPTAGLHFSEELLGRLREAGVGLGTLTLHVGVGTFRPLVEEDLLRGELHAEHFEVDVPLVEAIRRTRAKRGRVIAIGTTSARALESATPEGARIPEPCTGKTTLFIRPPYRFRCIDGLLTNFHLPRSSLLMLVAALIGRERLLAAYDEAVARGYRFYSYGDAMLLL